MSMSSRGWRLNNSKNWKIACSGMLGMQWRARASKEKPGVHKHGGLERKSGVHKKISSQMRLRGYFSMHSPVFFLRPRTYALPVFLLLPALFTTSLASQKVQFFNFGVLRRQPVMKDIGYEAWTPVSISCRKKLTKWQVRYEHLFPFWKKIAN